MAANSKAEQRIPRSLADRIGALRKHLRILREYHQRTFVDRNFDYAGEVAAKLRLLAVDFGKSNRALLLDLMKETGIEVPLVYDGPNLPGGPVSGVTSSSLAEKFASVEPFVRLRVGPSGRMDSTGEMMQVTASEFVRGWAEQAGAAHEDPTHSPMVAATLAPTGFRLLGYPIHILALRGLSQTVLLVGERFLSDYEARQATKAD